MNSFFQSSRFPLSLGFHNPKKRKREPHFSSVLILRHNLFSPLSHRRRFSIINKTIKLYFRSPILSKPHFVEVLLFFFTSNWCYCSFGSWINKYKKSWNVDKIISFLLWRLLQSNFTLALCYKRQKKESSTWPDRLLWGLKSNTLNIVRDISRSLLRHLTLSKFQFFSVIVKQTAKAMTKAGKVWKFLIVNSQNSSQKLWNIRKFLNAIDLPLIFSKNAWLKWSFHDYRSTALLCCRIKPMNRLTWFAYDFEKSTVPLSLLTCCVNESLEPERKWR
jgi:hypothetical protein